MHSIHFLHVDVGGRNKANIDSIKQNPIEITGEVARLFWTNDQTLFVEFF
jgi:hypothetical protein